MLLCIMITYQNHVKELSIISSNGKYILGMIFEILIIVI